MPDRTLGMDVGTNSIGWALIDEEGRKVVAAGVRIFPEGVDRDTKGGEVSKNQARRQARGIRRQIARRKRRKNQLHKALLSVGLLPADPSEWEQLLRTDPYLLRAKALDEPLQPFELGRVLFHLGQRRGFLSNRKASPKSRQEDKGLETELGQLSRAIDAAGARTLGEYLYGLRPDQAERSAQRIRNRHTHRQMLEAEFEAIWQKQREFHPGILTEELKYGRGGRRTYPCAPVRSGGHPVREFGIHGILFFQRKMYWPRTSIGKCELEPKERRCPRANRAAQRFRILQEVNNLRFIDTDTGEEVRLADSQRTLLISYLESSRGRTFDQIRKKLGLPESMIFNIEKGDRDKLQGNETDAVLGGSKGIGKRWSSLSETDRDRIVSTLLGDAPDTEVIRSLREGCGLTEQEAEAALRAPLPEGHASYSETAIRRLLPFLERGLLLMANDASDSALHAAGYLRPDERSIGQRRFLPRPPELTNPIVRQALVEVRKIVNAVIRKHGSPARVHVELVRDAKKSFRQRSEIRIENARRRRAREAAASALAELGISPKRGDIDRYMLWREQGESCPYCGQKISLHQLVSGETDVDHILPRWRSLDDSLANKVVTHVPCNREKMDRTPREWLEEADPDRYQRVLHLARILPYGKRQKFLVKEVVLEDFIARQLSDTAYISTQVAQYLKCLGVPIVVPRGQMTAELRHCWGLNSILASESNGGKNRADHRHHAVDAAVIALTNPSRLHALANARGRQVEAPWSGLREDLEKCVAGIVVSHRPRRRLRGALHEETHYGATQKREPGPGNANRPWAKGWIEKQGVYVVRKPVTEIKKRDHLDRIRDSALREVLKEHLISRGVDPDQAGEFPKGIFEGSNTPRMRSGVPIRRVRMVVESTTIRPVSASRAGQYIKPGSNHRIEYWSRGPSDKETWHGRVITLWDAVDLAHGRGHSADRADEDASGCLRLALGKGDSFLIETPEQGELVCVVRKLDQRSGRIYFRQHFDARETREIEKDNLYLSPARMQEYRARKVSVDVLGRLGLRRSGAGE